ncbi:MAG TPA: hypothetical protein ENJ02_09120, partial [Chloroflexi bacterium]|nr:hypothetical protein [Chloroflexota bacterium]
MRNIIHHIFALIIFTVVLLLGGCHNVASFATAAVQPAATPIIASAPTTRADGTVLLAIPASGSLQNPAWSPDSGKLLFTRFVNGYNTEPADLLTFDLTTKLTRTLVFDGSGNVNLPGSAWNRVTGYIAFSSSRDPHDEIY